MLLLRSRDSGKQHWPKCSPRKLRAHSLTFSARRCCSACFASACFFWCCSRAAACSFSLLVSMDSGLRPNEMRILQAKVFYQSEQ